MPDSIIEQLKRLAEIKTNHYVESCADDVLTQIQERLAREFMAACWSFDFPALLAHCGSDEMSKFNEDDERERNLIQSFVNNEFMVSTIYRQSSALVNDPPWYFETLVWEWDAEKKVRGNIIHSAASNNLEAARNEHMEICHQLLAGETLKDE